MFEKVNWNDTQIQYTRQAPKRAYYLSLEFLMGRTLDNALLNLGLKNQFNESTNKLGFNLEDLIGTYLLCYSYVISLLTCLSRLRT